MNFICSLIPSLVSRPHLRGEGQVTWLIPWVFGTNMQLQNEFPFTPNSCFAGTLRGQGV